MHYISSYPKSEKHIKLGVKRIMPNDALDILNLINTQSVTRVVAKKQEIVAYPEPSKVYITLYNVNGTLSVPINITNIAKYLECNRVILGAPGVGICRIRYARMDRNGIPDTGRQHKKGKNNMTNCINITIIPPWYNVPTKISDINKINVLLYATGNFRVTGARSCEEAARVLNDLIAKLIATNRRVTYRKNGKNITRYLNLIYAHDKMQPIMKNIVLINSQFYLNFMINREELANIIQRQYPVDVEYKPEKNRHRGVRISFLYNDLWRGTFTGVCYCKCGINPKCLGVGKCNGRCDPNNCRRVKKGVKNAGDGLNKCRVITIIIFRSGCIIITAGVSRAQIYEAYRFMLQITQKHYRQIVEL